MRIRFTKKPDPRDFKDIDVTSFHVGRVYDIPSTVAYVLIVSGYAMTDMRAADRPDQMPGEKGLSRRKEDKKADR
jgi:hypothetical protein